MKKIKGTGADAVFLGGLIDENGAQVIKDKVAVLGPNDGDVKLFAPDGFTTQATIDEAGPAVGRHVHVGRGRADRRVPGPRARSSSTALLAGPLAGKAIDPYAIYGAQSAQIVLDAIASSDGSRDGRHREDVRDRGHGRAARLVRLQRERRPGGRVGRRRRLHDVRGDRQARDVRQLLAEAGDRRRPQARKQALDQTDEAGGHCPPASFRV